MSSAMNGEIRPGVRRPDWSLVTKPRAREALLERDDARNNLAGTWARPLSPQQDLVWRAVLELFAALGRPPDVAEIGQRTGIRQERVHALLSELQTRDLLGIDGASGAISYAYPFTVRSSGHRIELRGRTLNALCAIDALGVGGMFRTDVTITSCCRHCGTVIEIGTAESGRERRRRDAEVTPMPGLASLALAASSSQKNAIDGQHEIAALSL